MAKHKVSIIKIHNSPLAQTPFETTSESTHCMHYGTLKLATGTISSSKHKQE